MKFSDISDVCLGTWQFSGSDDMMWGSSFNETTAGEAFVTKLTSMSSHSLMHSCYMEFKATAHTEAFSTNLAKMSFLSLMHIYYVSPKVTLPTKAFATKITLVLFLYFLMDSFYVGFKVVS